MTTVVPANTVPPWTLALTAMFSVQLGSALSVNLIHDVGAAGYADRTSRRWLGSEPPRGWSPTKADSGLEPHLVSSIS
ncbi:hypothetical protein [Nostocoides sp. HKS02]|uniref:hypothetical protein n=1 Tax=Nostocoides sp. HKS02 TaxID=1813880 RepID=UPI0012B49DD1|nr:hypothetical protein [Tetrasphaera sp. HKS02]QGN59205.1 hypothetical protein GKE56_16405 [Tetrasphaera sp. HKS02]